MKKKMFYLFDCLIILTLMVYTLLDTFVITRNYQVVESVSETQSNISQQTASTSRMLVTEVDAQPVLSDTSYEDENISINIEEYRYKDTTIYVADVQVSSIDYLYTAFANNTYGKNVTEKTSIIAQQNNALLAINGDYYGARNSGYTLRNGELYRNTSSSSTQEDLVIERDGSFTIIEEGSIRAEDLENSGALQVFSFGPALIVDGEIEVGLQEEVGKAMASNPRTALCEIEPLHYLFVVSDGRTDESEGLSLYELATFLESLNVKTAYNLDGGGSSTMVFNGELINNPTTSGRKISERSVSDVICIGY